MKPIRLISLFAIVCAALFASSKCDDFGKGIKPFTKAKSQMGVVDFSGDYNGDGMIDRLVFMHLPARPNFAKDVNVVYMFGDKPEYRDGSLGIAFILSGKTSAECKKYIIYNEGFFDSDNEYGASMWDDPSALPFYLIKKDNKGYVKLPIGYMDYFQWKEQMLDLSTDAIVVISPSLAGILIYWKDQTFHAEWEKDFDP
jgi:hypothetical protein